MGRPMNYSIGNTGRAIVLRLEHGDPIYACIEEVAEKEGLDSGVVWIIGAIINGGVVVGPERDDEMPPRPIVERFGDAREILGVGTIFKNTDGKSKLHMHAAIGKRKDPIVGCPCKGAECWLIDEVVILELVNIKASRTRDAKSGLELMSCLEQE